MPKNAIVAINKISKSFNATRAVDRVSFTLKKAERVAVIGPNGAGKSTLLNVLSGELAPEAGSVFLGGKDITRSQSAE